MNPPQNSWPLSWVERWHRKVVSDRRVRVLADILASQMPRDASVLDVGCGNGKIGSLLAANRRDLSIEGVEVATRPGCLIPCHSFDGMHLPFADGTFDVCMVVDVLHHTDDICLLMREVARVSRSFVLIKDHICENKLDRNILKVMDWVGNRPHGVRLTFNYQSHLAWTRHFAECSLIVTRWTNDVPLHSFPLSLITGRKLHFVSLLQKV
jgi:SAM-dependent methyltransferase